MIKPLITHRSASRATTKYRNCPSGVYASRKEARRAAQLRLMQQQGLITDLREQVSYTLIPAQYRNAPNGKHTLVERSCRYIADFVYTDNASGQTVVEDTKGVRTKEYIIKRKLMLHVHNIQIHEI